MYKVLFVNLFQRYEIGKSVQNIDLFACPQIADFSQKMCAVSCNCHAMMFWSPVPRIRNQEVNLRRPKIGVWGPSFQFLAMFLTCTNDNFCLQISVEVSELYWSPTFGKVLFTCSRKMKLESHPWLQFSSPWTCQIVFLFKPVFDFKIVSLNWMTEVSLERVDFRHQFPMVIGKKDTKEQLLERLQFWHLFVQRGKRQMTKAFVCWRRLFLNSSLLK